MTPRPRDPVEQGLAAWRVHNGINLLLLEGLPAAAMGVVPTGSRGRTVGEQFFHMNRVRLGWLEYHATGRRPRAPRVDKETPPTRAQLRMALRASGAAVEGLLARSLAGEAKIRMFGGNPFRWMGYLISHESHHRGQVALALKQGGIRLPEKLALQGLWGRWFWGK